MGMKHLWLMVSLAAMAACGSEKNPNLCCTTPTDCSAVGLSEPSSCSDGLLCRGNQCIAESCSVSSDCEAGAPFCAANNLCAAECETDSQCPGFGGNNADKLCESGKCVQCRLNSDCTIEDAPVCDQNVCRGCLVDTDCASGVCGSSGACVDASAILYVAPVGADVGACTQDAPCATLNFALTQASASRATVTLAKATYVSHAAVRINTPFGIDLHGNGSTIQAAGISSVFFGVSSSNASTVRDLSIDVSSGNEGPAVSVSLANFYNVTVLAGTGPSTIGVGTNTFLDARGLTVVGGNLGISVGGTAKLDQTVVHGSNTGISGTGVMNIQNTLVYDVNGLAVDLSSAQTATISFSTLTSKASSGGVVRCMGATLIPSITDSIIWLESLSGAPAIEAGYCAPERTLVGPAAVAGSSNANPLFVNPAGGDYHLNAGSPAIDMTDQGPAYDFEGDARPQGVRFDVGADEHK